MHQFAAPAAIVAAAVADGQSSVSIHLTFPPAFGYEHLGQLLHRSPASLQAAFSRKPASLPPAHRPLGTKQPLWLLTEVLAWLADQPGKVPARIPVEALAARKNGPGARTKAERIALGKLASASTAAAEPSKPGRKPNQAKVLPKLQGDSHG